MENNDFVSQHIRLTKEQDDWLREHCYKSRKSKAEVIREALEVYRSQIEKKDPPK